MPLDLPDGASCFLDANIFYYHFVETPVVSDYCTDLLERIARGVVTAFTSTHLLAEAIHKIMLAEAAARFNLRRPSLVNWLQANRHRIGELSEFPQAVRELSAMPVARLPIESADLIRTAEVCRDFSLLTNDALSIALMQHHGLAHLATNDDDFDDTPGLTIWKPR